MCVLILKFLFRPEKSCTIYCKQVRTPEYTSPQLYLTESDGVDLFFPDGTLCHNDGNQNYYCLKHQCIPGDQSRSPRTRDSILGQDVSVFQVLFYGYEIIFFHLKTY